MHFFIIILNQWFPNLSFSIHLNAMDEQHTCIWSTVNSGAVVTNLFKPKIPDLGLFER